VHLNEKGKFIIENYQKQKTFSSFLPGIAGKMGVPIWAFYVNRGQGIASFGIKNKDHAIMEFNPANKSYQLTPLKGFRTFIKFIESDYVYEPFKKTSDKIKNKMIIEPYSLTLKEVNHELDLEILINYFILPGENFGSLVRRVNIKNLADKDIKLEVLDGLPEVIPEGLSNQALKEVSQTMSGWCRVDNMEEKMPFFRISATADDKPEVKEINSGHFFLSFSSDNGDNKILQPLVDPEIIFANNKSFLNPVNFERKILADFQGEQLLENRYPSAMSSVIKKVNGGDEIVINSFYGHTSSKKKLETIKKKILEPGYVNYKEKENKKIHNYYLDHIFTVSNYSQFDQYCRQTFLDNVLRGGFPSEIGDHTYHLFSRKHGDLERDYNFFQLEPNYFSQGNGNYRDVNQNRRSDNLFNPKVQKSNIKLFANLIQIDGFNPLLIKGLSFHLKRNDRKEFIKLVKNKKTLVDNRLKKQFTPGDLGLFITDNEVKLSVSLEEFINKIMKKAESKIEAEHGEGFWIDHWTYLLDLIKNYLAVYPEKEYELLINDNSYTYYDNYVRVNPRSEKYVLTNNGPRQLDAVKVDEEKKAEIKNRKFKSKQLRKKNGKIFKTNLMNKLLAIVVNKLASFDPEGVGIEMEANKPGWYDALNGLPGIFGSSTPEVMELYRLVDFLIEKIDKIKPNVKLPVEVYDFIRELEQELVKWQKQEDDFSYWDQATSLKEVYRNKVFKGINGQTKEMQYNELKSFLNMSKMKLNSAIKKSYNKKSGLYNTYYYYLPEEYEKTGFYSKKGNQYIKVKEFAQHALPPFLEGQVRAMKILENKEKILDLHQSVCKSELYDKKLKMYRLNGDLSDMPDDIGRARAFSSGWLENGSIWLHMEYKYLLELLKSNLNEEFYKVMKDVLIPFQDPERYGRSILENSSFIMSSLNTDVKNHGRGYIARLSGSTAEFLHIWSLIAFGPKPFVYENNKLCFKPRPILQKDIFTQEDRDVSFQLSKKKKVNFKIPKNSFAFRLLGHTIAVYNNPKNKNTFGDNKVKIKSFEFLINGEKIEIKGSKIKGEYAKKLRNGKIDYLFINLK